jgi:hypothetical protein
MNPFRTPKLTRREFFALALGLSACSVCGIASAGGIAAWLILRRYLSANMLTPATPQPVTAVAALTPTPDSPTIVPREGWNARPINHEATKEYGFASTTNPNGWYVYEGDLATIYRTVVMHHSYPILRDTGTMRQVQDLHLDSDHWADIGYHFGIDGQGVIYAGRDIHVRGASVAGYNTGTIGVVLIGNFESETPADAQIAAFTSLVGWLKKLYGITHLAGHFEFNSITVCPGRNAVPYLDPIAKTLTLKRGTGGYVPLATPKVS